MHNIGKIRVSGKTEITIVAKSAGLGTTKVTTFGKWAHLGPTEVTTFVKIGMLRNLRDTTFRHIDFLGTSVGTMFANLVKQRVVDLQNLPFFAKKGLPSRIISKFFGFFGVQNSKLPIFSVLLAITFF